ncbi:MAG: o-succinylbenzoate--CoA ligase [Bacteroidetes bacterium]|nr:MAG: o-succinylbenzoate--CoA ligase [Bacteroidota bacterium]
MFLDIDKKVKSDIAAIDDYSSRITYGQLCDFSVAFNSYITSRTLIFILSENCIGSLSGFVAALSGGIVPLLISSNTERGLLRRLIEIYKPSCLWIPDNMSDEFDYKPIYHNSGYVLLNTGFPQYPLYEQLSFLLPTSGSTGSPKLVRHSYNNIAASARNVASFFELKSEDRAIGMLPMHYTMGLSVITSHLYAGATVLLTKKSLTDKEFWEFVKVNRATSFTGVPYSYEVLYKLRFFRMDLPDLRLLTQGGGKLSDQLFREYAEYAEKTGRRFIATYGQTEGTARMAYLPADLATSKTGSIGKAIPGGSLSLCDDTGIEINENEATGEMVYHGPNVTLGYATNPDDLLKGDENRGMLKTGDIARRDTDGCYFIVGRISRFLKLYGLRISLDEVEQMIKSGFNIDCICSGDDEMMKIYITEEDKKTVLHEFIVEKTGLFHKAIEIIVLDELKRNEAGKTIYI